MNENIFSNLKYQPEDFETVISLDELTKSIKIIIDDIRTNGKQYQSLLAIIQEMKEYFIYPLGKKTSKSRLLKANSLIQKASLILKYFLGEGDYDSVAYTFYYKGKRYTASNLKASWLRRTSKGELEINLNKAVKSIQRSMGEAVQSQVFEALNKHYSRYLTAITNMYKGESDINQGYVAEAFERHLFSHHNKNYEFFNDFTQWSALDKMLMAQDTTNIVLEYQERIKDLPDKYWAFHETPEEAWKHVRASTGRMRGTAGGDVANRQVKSAQNSKNASLDLVSYQNLQLGLNRYCAILSDIDSEKVARDIAMYISDLVQQDTQQLQADIVNKEILRVI